MSMAKLSETLKERGYAYQFSSPKLEEITDGKKRTVYLGIDPSADSLHVGNLMGLLVLRRFLDDGHKVIILTGGGTGMVGDPGGKSEERNLLDEETLAENTKAVATQIRQVFGKGDFIEENNAKWLAKLNLLEFLRDVGKHFTVNAMIKKDIVRDRLEKESPLSFTEFSYALLQAYDFLHLNTEYGCDVQVGGSDQWSNILSGVEFIRRKENKEVYALTWPLIVDKSTGKKFGKSEEGAVWLSAEKTSPFKLYQFFFNAEDNALEELLLKLTLLSKNEIDLALEMHKRNPGARHGQEILAREVTTLVHGAESASKAERVSQVLFGDGAAMDADISKAVMQEAPNCAVEEGDLMLDVLVKSSLATSKREARELLSKKGISLNGEAVDEKRKIEKADMRDGIALLKRGKRSVCVLTLS
jgi:tyrosyl-tRNA synthetase